MEKGTIFLEPFWGRQSLKPQRALLLSSTWSTPPGRCSQARWGWCGWRGGRGPGGTGRGPAPDSASSEDTHHSSAITEIEVSPAYLGSCEQGAGGRGVLSQSLTVRTQSLSARRGVRCEVSQSQINVCWPGLTHLVSVSELGLATDLWLALHLTGEQQTARAGPHKYKLFNSNLQCCNCSLQC